MFNTKILTCMINDRMFYDYVIDKVIMEESAIKHIL